MEYAPNGAGEFNGRKIRDQGGAIGVETREKIVRKFLRGDDLQPARERIEIQLGVEAIQIQHPFRV